MQESSNEHPYFATRSKLAKELARGLYAEICGTVNQLPIFGPWKDGRPLLDAMIEMEPEYVIEGPEVSRDEMEQAYHELDDEAKEIIAKEWERLINTLHVANEVTMTAMECAYKIGQKLQVGGLEAFEEKTTEVIPSKPQPAKAVAREETETYARLAATALWKTAMRPWQFMMGGLVAVLVMLVSYGLMDHVDAMTTPIAMEDVAPLEMTPTDVETVPSISAELLSEPASPTSGATGEDDRQTVVEQDMPQRDDLDVSDDSLGSANRQPTSRQQSTPSQRPLNARAAVSMGHKIQHLVLTPENSENTTVDDKTAITVSIKPGVPREVEGSSMATRHLVVPSIPEFSLELEIDPDLVNVEQPPSKLKRKVTLTWSETRGFY